MAIALRPIYFSVYVLDILKRHLITYPPWHMPLISGDFDQDGLKTPIRLSSVDDPRLSFVPLIQLPIPARRELPVEGNIRYLSIRYVSVFDIYHTVRQCPGTEYLSWVIKNEARCADFGL